MVIIPNLALCHLTQLFTEATEKKEMPLLNLSKF